MYILNHTTPCVTYILTEPTVYTDSEFGDGNVPIIFSNLECKGYEESLNKCNKKNYGNFSCSRKKLLELSVKMVYLTQDRSFHKYNYVVLQCTHRLHKRESLTDWRSKRH